MPDRAVVVGTGGIARRHLRNLRALRPELELGVVRRPASATPISELGVGLADRVFNDLDEALSWLPDIAVVAGPSVSHVPVSIRLVSAGVHVLIEKPLADRFGEAEKLVAACLDSGGTTVAVGYNLRHHAAVRAVRDTVAAGAIGRPLTARAEVGQNLSQWRPGREPRATVSATAALGGGALLELSHDIDYMRWVLGEVVSVTACCSTSGLFGDEVEDVADLLLAHDSGVVSAVHLDMVDHRPGRRCRVVGEGGTVLWDSVDGGVSLRRADGTSCDVRVGTPGDGDDAYVAELEEFLRRCEAGDPSLEPLREAARVVQLVDAARASAASGCRVGM